jgi:uncharacterized membrane protein YhaH (DUF805 family)
MENLQPLLFSFEGRINRARFWIGILVIVAIEIVGLIVATVIGYLVGAELAMILFYLVVLVMLWPSIALGVKRFHDRNKSGWWVLISLVPIIGGIWYLVECGFLEGTKGPNQFGPDPLQMPATA